MTYDESRYCKGYSIGVGGVVLCGEKVLLTRRAQGDDRGDWAIPGGFVEHDETIDAAVQREVLEETGVKGELKGLIAVRSRVTNSENSAYLIFLLRADTEEAQADGSEIDEARYFTLVEVQALPRLQILSKFVATQVLERKTKALVFYAHPEFQPGEYTIFA